MTPTAQHVELAITVDLTDLTAFNTEINRTNTAVSKKVSPTRELISS